MIRQVVNTQHAGQWWPKGYRSLWPESDWLNPWTSRINLGGTSEKAALVYSFIITTVVQNS